MDTENNPHGHMAHGCPTDGELHERLKCCLLEEMNNNKNNHSICLKYKSKQD